MSPLGFLHILGPANLNKGIMVITYLRDLALNHLRQLPTDSEEIAYHVNTIDDDESTINSECTMSSNNDPTDTMTVEVIYEPWLNDIPFEPLDFQPDGVLTRRQDTLVELLLHTPLYPSENIIHPPHPPSSFTTPHPIPFSCAYCARPSISASDAPVPVQPFSPSSKGGVLYWIPNTMVLIQEKWS